jgi:hypothetical protein
MKTIDKDFKRGDFLTISEVKNGFVIQERVVPGQPTWIARNESELIDLLCDYYKPKYGKGVK